jgi:hypothetical protein
VFKRFLGWALFGVCAAAVLFVVVGGHVGTVVVDPLRLWGRWFSGEKLDGVRYLPFLLVGGIPVLLWIAVARGLLIPVSDGLTKAFGGKRPGHPLRWIAFVLFVVGFGLDLLAS